MQRFRALYAPWPDGARRSWGWATVFIVLLGYVIANLPTALGVGIYVAIQVANGTTPEAAQASINSAFLYLLLPLILVQFLIWGWFARAWVRRFERRDPDSVGLTGIMALPRYLFGLILGAGMLIALGWVVAQIGGGGDLDGQLPGMDGLVVPSTTALIWLGIIAGVFLIQGAVEEYIFRGWLMSVLVARWGMVAGVVGSTLIFGLFHLHVFAAGVEVGLAAIIGITMTGLVYALLCVLTGRIYEAMAAHGIFNALALGGPAYMELVQKPDQDLNQVFADVFANATATAGEMTLQPANFAQMGVMAVLSLVLILLIRMRRTCWV